jgi:signal transduction histidine kinase/CHASE3 domain sensor protein
MNGVAHQLRVILELDGFLATLNNAESEERAFVLTGQNGSAESYRVLSTRVREKLDRLHNLAVTSDLRDDMVDELSKLTEQSLVQMERTMSVRRASGLAAAANAVREEEQRDTTRNIAAEVARIRTVEEGELIDDDKRGTWAATLRTQVLVTGCLLNLIFLWWGYRIISSESLVQHRAMLDMSVLQKVGVQCARSGSRFQECLQEIVEAAIALTDADKGTVQLLTHPDTLRIAAHKGVHPEYIEAFGRVNPDSGTACGEVLQARQRITIYDVAAIASSPSKSILLKTGVRALQCTPLISSSGAVLGIISTHFSHPHSCSENQLQFMDLLARQTADYLERQRIENELMNAHEQLADRAVHLEELVKERTARLNQMVGDAEALSYSIVHDMRAPLRAMQSFAQLLAEECAPMGPTAEDYVRRIMIGATRLDHLIRDALTYNRVMREELPLSAIDVNSLLCGILDTYPEFQPPALRVEVLSKLPLVHANEAALTECISNLLSNVIKFVQPGSTPTVRIWAETDNTNVRIYFRDNGIGIRKEAHEKIFQIFQRLDHSYPGTGIGLAVVKKAVERMGGKIGLESEPEKGSTFWLVLPCAHLSDQVDEAETPECQNP